MFGHQKVTLGGGWAGVEQGLSRGFGAQRPHVEVFPDLIEQVVGTCFVWGIFITWLFSYVFSHFLDISLISTRPHALFEGLFLTFWTFLSFPLRPMLCLSVFHNMTVFIFSWLFDILWVPCREFSWGLICLWMCSRSWSGVMVGVTSCVCTSVCVIFCICVCVCVYECMCGLSLNCLWVMIQYGSLFTRRNACVY